MLMPVCRSYTVQSGRRITFEWALIQGLNDGDEQAAALTDWVHRMNCHVNIIPLNPTDGYEGKAAKYLRTGWNLHNDPRPPRDRYPSGMRSAGR